MTERRRGLGRGLGALIPTAPADGADAPEGSIEDAGSPAAVDLDVSAEQMDGATVSRETSAPDEEHLVPVSGATFAEIPVDAITPNPRQPRQDFDEDSMEELAYSIGQVGLLQPIVVRQLGGGRYELVMGERRWRASQRAELATIPAIVRSTTDDEMLRDALLENLHRSELNPLEEAAAYQQLLDDFSCTHDELAERIGRSRPQISNTLRLLKLPPLVQRRVAAGVLSAGHARALLGADAATQERMAQRIVAEGLSVRSVEEIVAMGDDETAPQSKKRKPKPVAPRLDDIASALSERLETRVKVDLGRSKGKVTIEFASIDDLDRIVAAIDPSISSANQQTNQ
ncbi:ParB/RepB/Spo0J family partition protein [Actinobacteria bacterium YIM 96077]|uniref:Chromosome partitioning protein ParB n=1 Tax=Phytoactinopolyspora halophila TaxID=1981511 RepID=A0A329QR87_9ACTN|nr:ParB/RepB/Spo0J family partition protein [Phytoactinopolyspora halophila]AYY15107.1 ParB/RepB/Spo0J family partition protein [Actinobacteria bacterium YIM 96077]RAW14713.1 chromosome partitioning protein ParB [Phytoactinopolyspora halophila]